MLYYKNTNIMVRTMNDTDPQIFTDGELAQGWHTSISKLETRMREMSEGKCIVITADYDGVPTGYVSIYPDCKRGAFGGKGLPEIVDFNVLEKYRRMGIGTKLMDVAEEIAGQYADTVCLGVGMMSGYGSAQRMYIKRGYIPDGSGVWYGDNICEPYTNCVNDDDLVLYLSKKLI